MTAALLLGAPAAAGGQEIPVTLIDGVFAEWGRDGSPGCALGVYRDGRLAFSKGWGLANLEHGVPISPGSIFHVASISKQFTAAAIGMLALEGRLSLDDDVRAHVPEVPDFGERITIRHLIHHTSGLRDQWELLSLAGWRPDDPKTESDILELVSRQRELNFRPGEEHLYSNTGYTLLAVIVRRVTGQSLREFAEARIFGPLGMTRTHFHDDHSMVVPGRTAAYVRRADGWAISQPVFDNHGATSLFTTVEDLAKWEANFVAPVVGTAELFELMHTRGRLNDGREIPYAFALVHGDWRGLRTVGHSGSDAGYRADYLRVPDSRVAFATMCNVPANAGALNRRVAAAVLGLDVVAEPAVPPRAEPGGVAAEGVTVEAGAFVGRYYSEELDASWDIVRVDGGLVVRRRKFADRPLTLAGPDLLGGANWRLAFERNVAGSVTGFRLSTGRVRNLAFARR